MNKPNLFLPFYIGEKVVCTEDFEIEILKRNETVKEKFPTFNKTYTVREILPPPEGSNKYAIRLKEVINPSHSYDDGEMELAFLEFCFRPKNRVFKPLLTKCGNAILSLRSAN